jgi:hypothetical protein
MKAKSLRFLFEGGAGLAVEGMSEDAAQAARDAFSRFLQSGGNNVLTLLVPGETGQDEFIVDMRRVVALHVASDPQA